MNKKKAGPAPRIINCPGCKRKIRYDENNPFRPFCSARCKEIDIAAWATESYRIPVAVSESGAEERPPVDDEEE